MAVGLTNSTAARIIYWNNSKQRTKPLANKKARALPVAKRPVSEPRQKAFLEVLAKTGIVAEASRLASAHSKDRKAASGSFYSLRRRDPHFAAAWDAAQEQADAALLLEARRRAVHGSKRGIFQKGVRVVDHDGEPASETVYSDRLLELILKARFPNDFVERRQVEHVKSASGWQITGEDLHALNDRQTEALQDIMATVMEARGEIERDPVMEAAEIDARMIDVTPMETVEIEPTDAELEAIEAEAVETAFPY